jgi:hypothetical protein
MPAAITPQRAALLLVPLLAALSGCPRVKVDLGKDGAPTSADDLLRRIGTAESQIFAVKGDGRLVVDSPQGKGAVTIFAAVSHPAFIHLEQLDFFGRPQTVFVTDGTSFGLYDAQQGKYFRGPATAPNLSRFLPVVMPPTELASVMLGRAPRIQSQSREMRFDDALQVFVLMLKRGDVTQYLHVQPPSYRVVKSWAEGITAYELAFSDIAAPNPGVTLPKVAALEVAVAKTKLELTWKDITVNEAPDLTLFDLEPPEGVAVVEVDASGNPRQPPPQ